MSGGGSGARRIGVALLLTVLALTMPGLAFVYGSTQSAPRPRPAGVLPPDLALRPVRIARGASYVAAWFDAAPQRRASVMLVHGIRSSRHSMLERARFLGRAGYAVLLVDLQAHGETPGEVITFGYRESRDVARVRSRGAGVGVQPHRGGHRQPPGGTLR
jgi:pimeloyl-ACP methyl ester carboxylesterase